jgi:hypothetical protein
MRRTLHPTRVDDLDGERANSPARLTPESTRFFGGSCQRLSHALPEIWDDSSLIGQTITAVILHSAFVARNSLIYGE